MADALARRSGRGNWKRPPKCATEVTCFVGEPPPTPNGRNRDFEGSGQPPKPVDGGRKPRTPCQRAEAQGESLKLLPVAARSVEGAIEQALFFNRAILDVSPGDIPEESARPPRSREEDLGKRTATEQHVRGHPTPESVPGRRQGIGEPNGLLP